MALSLCVYFAASIITCRISIAGERAKLEQLRQQIYDQQLRNEDLTRLLTDGGDAAYIEKIAREKLGYAAADERVFVDVAGS